MGQRENKFQNGIFEPHQVTKSMVTLNASDISTRIKSQKLSDWIFLNTDLF